VKTFTSPKTNQLYEGHTEVQSSTSLSEDGRGSMVRRLLSDRPTFSNSEEQQNRQSIFENPFLEEANERHPPNSVLKIDSFSPNGADGYIKFKWTHEYNIAPLNLERAQDTRRYIIPSLPAGFGRTFNFDLLDKLLMKFCEYPRLLNSFRLFI
jgi:hypothetical protein